MACSHGVIYYGGPYDFVSSIDYVEISPQNGNFTDCSVLSELPPGLEMNNKTCSIFGIPHGIVTDLEVSVVSLSPMESRGTFRLTVRACESNAFEILRTYGPSSVVFELFTVVDDISHETLVNVTLNTPKKGGEVVSYRFCSSTQQLRITLGSSVYEEWYTGSKLEVYGLSYDSKKDLLLGCHMDTLAGLPTVYLVNVAYSVRPHGEWFYWMDSLPINWESSYSISWNSSHVDTFPSSNNQIQLYKQLFYNKDSSYGTYEINLRYQCGCVVYVNGIEVYRHHLPSGSVTNDTLATHCFPTLAYHSIILPTALQVNNTWHSLFNAGRNLIAIALISNSSFPCASHFDASFRFTGMDSQYRSFSLSSFADGFDGPSDAATDWNHETFLSCETSCSPNASVVLSFPTYREEFITTVEIVSSLSFVVPGPLALQFEARTSEFSNWIPLLYIPSIQWGVSTRKIRFWVHGSQPFQQYRITNLTTIQGMRITEILLSSEQMDRMVPPFSFSPVTMSVFTSIESVFPSSPHYFNFSVSPDLPQGLQINPMTGEIYGVPEVEVNSKFSITATRFDGKLCTTDFSLTVLPCHNDHSLYQLHLLTDHHISASFWRLIEGLSLDGPIIEEETISREQPHNETFLFCLPQGFYTFLFVESSGSGWTVPAGYSLTTSQGNFVVATGTLPRVYPDPESNCTFSFQTYQPIQPRTSLWHLCIDNQEGEDWTSLSFDDYQWDEVHTDVISTLQLSNPTIYLRRRFVRDDMNLYSAMRIQMRFAGGIIVYFNGNIVYRLNLPENAAYSDYATEDHDVSSLVQFTIPLRAMYAKDGENILAAEVHMAETSAALPQAFDFDCIAILDPTEAAVVSTSYERIDGSAPLRGHVTNLLDMDITTLYRPPFEVGTYWEWTFQNQAKTIFNEYWITAGNRVQNFTWNLFGRFDETEKWILIDSQRNLSLFDRMPRKLMLPKGAAGFKSIRFEVAGDVSVSVFQLMEFFLVYQFPQDSYFCPTEGDFIAVEDGSVSYSSCPAGYSGVSSRKCEDQEWQDIDLSECYILPPSSFGFDQQVIRFPSRSAHAFASHVEGIVDHYEVEPDLPTGLHLSSKGVLKGRVNFAVPRTNYTIYAINDAGTAKTVVEIEVYDRWCEATSLCPRMKVGDECELNCQDIVSNTVGRAYKKCVALNEEQGTWGESEGKCMSLALMIAIVSLGLLILLFLFVEGISWIVKIRSRSSYRKMCCVCSK